MEDAISRDEMKARLYKLRSRTDQWKPSAFRAGYREAVDFALSDAESCRAVEAVLITRCHECKKATERQSTMPYCMIHKRRKNPDDFCNYGEPDE